MAETAKDDTGPRSFAKFAHDLGGGDFNEDMSTAQHELSNYLQDLSLNLGGNAKVKGKLSIDIIYEYDARGNVSIDWNHKLTKPPKKRAKAQAWVTKQGHLVFEQPRQGKLALEEVGSRRKVREDDDRDDLTAVSYEPR